MRLQTSDDLAVLIVEQTALLAAHPLWPLAASSYLLGSLGQVLTHMIEVQQVCALVGKVVAELIDDPGGTITQSMHLSFVLQSRG